jgi:hypothetical protein
VRFTPVLSSDQAATLYDLVKEHRTVVIGQRSPRYYNDLLSSLAQIDRGGGAAPLREPLDYGRGVVSAAIIYPATHLAWLGTETIPEPFHPVGELPPLTYKATVWRPVTLCRVKEPLAVLRLPPVALPPLPLR